MSDDVEFWTVGYIAFMLKDSGMRDLKCFFCMQMEGTTQGFMKSRDPDTRHPAINIKLLVTLLAFFFLFFFF